LIDLKHFFSIFTLLVALPFGGSTYLSAQNLNKPNPMQTYDTITFGTGCFWCSQAIFERVEGVISSTVGYSGGKTPNPTYRDVSTGTTGYAEVVQVVYDPTRVSLKTLLEIFWKTHNPTTLNRQGADVGTQYRSVIFYHNEAQKQLAEAYKQKLEEAGVWDQPIVTEISPFRNFYSAEKYHQEYYKNNPAAAYCQFVITPKVEKFKKVFADKTKK
jgi:peptide-methionine (S)-S-oxide reductase